MSQSLTFFLGYIMIAEYRFYITLLLTGLTGLVGAINYKKFPSIGSRLIVVSIFVSLLLDFIGHYFTRWTGVLNFSIYNLYTFLSFSMYFFILYKLLKNSLYKNVAKLILYVFFIFFLVNIFFNFTAFTHNILSALYVYAVVGFLILSILSLKELYDSDEILHCNKSVHFWFLMAVLAFHIPFLPILLSVRFYMIDYDSSIFGYMFVGLQLVMSICLIYGFLCSHKKYNY